MFSNKTIYKNVANFIVNNKSKDSPFIVGINGVDTSGKSYFTKELNNYLIEAGYKTQIISIDDFHNPSKIRNSGNDPITSYVNNAFDTSKIEKELLKPMSFNEMLDKELIVLDLEKDEFNITKKYVVDKETIVLFEGVLLFREPLDKYFDMRIYLDISFDEVLNRAKKRDASLFGDSVVERYKKKYIPIQKIYIKKYEPKSKSHIIIDNEDLRNPKIIKTQ